MSEFTDSATQFRNRHNDIYTENEGREWPTVALMLADQLAASEQALAAEREKRERAEEKAEDFDLVTVMNKKLCSDLDAAKALVADLEQQQFAGQTWVTFDEHMKALNKIKQMEDAIKFDFERFMEFQRRAEQAESQYAASEKDHAATWQRAMLAEEIAYTWYLMYEALFAAGDEMTIQFDVELDQAEARAAHYKSALTEIAKFDGWKSDIAKQALEDNNG